MPKNNKPKLSRRSRSVPIDSAQMKAYFDERGKKPSDALRKVIERGRIDRDHFVRAMEAHRVERKYWPHFLPDGGVPDVEPKRPQSAEPALVWFPTASHLAGVAYSPLTWGGSGSNDSLETLQMRHPLTGDPVPVLPLDMTGPEPALRLRFRHRISGVKTEDSWWSAVVAFAPATQPPDWKTVDLTTYRTLKVFLRAYIDPAKKDVPLPFPIAIAVRFEDDNILPDRCLHPSSSLNRKPIRATQWSRPTLLDLAGDFDWGADAFFAGSPPVDRTKIIQLTFGQDGNMPDCEGYVDIQRIELHT